MEEVLTYRYSAPSLLRQRNGRDELQLAKYSEIAKASDAACFFHGQVKQPFMMARCLLALSNVVKSSFNLSPAQLALLKDPVVSAGYQRVRFEGFSHCAGVYARLDILPDGLDGEFLQSGTTNVDFNQPMLSALAAIRHQQAVMLSVGQQSVAVQVEEHQVIERKVPLPVKWIKGLSSVQVYFAQSVLAHQFSRVQAQQLFRSLPKGQVKIDYFLTQRGNTPQFSPVKSAAAICIGGLHRLRLLEPLLPFIDKLRVFAHPQMQSTSWQLYIGDLCFCLSLSRDCWRGFSGEGATLSALNEGIDEGWLTVFDEQAQANQPIDPAFFAATGTPWLPKTDTLPAQLAAMGLLGFDLDDGAYFYRQLPFKPARILSLNPRLKGADKLIADDKVAIVSQQLGRIEARVAGSGVQHTVILDSVGERCTCAWYSKYQGERGPCKHVLAVKKRAPGSHA
ncbi:TPA: SWIM zinc finger family protein [Klebsiella aerogenes]|nr:SWIM zinc finger family protein [Klebsiella aerogenes]